MDHFKYFIQYQLILDGLSEMDIQQTTEAK
jgi:hypothetical protein